MRYALVLAALAVVGCSKNESAGTATPPAGNTTAAVHTASTAAAHTAAPALPSGSPASIKGVTQAIGSAPVQLALKSAKTDHDGYLMTFEVTNKGTKEIKAIYYSGCTYDHTGKKIGPSPNNGVDVAVKPNAKGDAEISLGKQSDGPAAAGLAVTEIKYADGSKWEDHMVSCPDTTKL